MKRYAVISVYDGHRVNAGRVATDGTWHHWFDLNIKGIEAAGGVNWDKIGRYYLNMAMWLAPPGKTVSSLAWHVLVSHFKYPGIEEYSPNASVFDLGKTLYADLAGILGPCGITSGVFERIAMIDEDFGNWADDNLFSNDGEALRSEKLGFLSPPLELIVLAVLGGMVRAMLAAAGDVRDWIGKDGKFDPKNISTEELVKQLDEGVAIGLNEVRKVLVRSTDETTADACESTGER